MNQRGNVILIVLLIATVVGGYFIYTNYSNNQTETIFQNQSVASPSPQATSKDSKPAEPIYSKRLFDKKDKFIGEINYPTEVVEMDDSNLVEISCTKAYLKQVDGKFSYYVNDSAGYTRINADQKTLNYMEKAKRVIGKEISDIQICQTRQDEAVLIVGEQLSGGGAGKNTYITLISKDSEISDFIFIPSQSYAYFSCYQPLLLTKDNIFYIKCNAGDGLRGYSEINKVNLVNKNVKSIIGCSSLGNLDTNEVKVNCDK